MPSWNRMFRKSVSSSSSGGADQSTASNPTTAASSSPPSDAGLPKSPAGPSPSKTSSWRFGWGGGGGSSSNNHNAASTTSNSANNRDEEQDAPELKSARKKKRKKARRSAAAAPAAHPSERELTEQNLRHQELLSAFTMSFGRSGRKQSGGGRTSGSGISPGCSRSASVDSGYAQGHRHPGPGPGPGQRLSVAGAPHMDDVRE